MISPIDPFQIPDTVESQAETETTMIQLIRDTIRDQWASVAHGTLLYKAMVDGPQVKRIGMGPEHAIAHRIGLGMSPERAAAREYLYRWNLALQSPVFG